MSLTSLKRILSAAAFAALLIAPIAGFAADAPLAKADVEKIVHDYIQTHPGEILDSVQAHQENTMREKQSNAVKTNRQTIYNDVLTPTAGNEDGDITVVEFFDYNCGYCKKVTPQILELIKEDKNVRVLFKDLPILGPSSETAAKWALAAYKQKKYLAFFTAMMESHGGITDAMLEKTAKDVGMDLAKAKADAASSEVLMQIERNRSLSANMGIRGTPAFVIGDELTPGAVSLADMKAQIAKARAAKKDEKK